MQALLYPRFSHHKRASQTLQRVSFRFVSRFAHQQDGDSKFSLARQARSQFILLHYRVVYRPNKTLPYVFRPILRDGFPSHVMFATMNSTSLYHLH
jgi:hypothetical protein